ncbi:hypothetical protein G7Y89_g10916 [Cudoniella acicularis]|uniref:Uncharacterized protein n=1 Tax=Cudoniella acicularis TaxID=354080 RepID=A0A8H4VYB2_9HELO|nr:hypothetical protein G7Y89_g10916 [Cudoniella acicularis]
MSDNPIPWNGNETPFTPPVLSARSTNLLAHLYFAGLDLLGILVFISVTVGIWMGPTYYSDSRSVPMWPTVLSNCSNGTWQKLQPPQALDFPLRPEPIPSFACGVIVVFAPLLVVAILQFGNGSFWEFYAGAIGNLKAVVATTFICTILKQTIGGFRPHFIEVCKPDFEFIMKEIGRERYWFNTTACTGNPYDIKKASQHHADDVVFGLVIGVSIGMLAYRSSFAAIFDFHSNHIPLPLFTTSSNCYHQGPATKLDPLALLPQNMPSQFASTALGLRRYYFGPNYEYLDLPSVDFSIKDGFVVAVNATLANINKDIWYDISTTLSLSLQAGCCLIMLLMIAILTKDEKRKLVYYLNVLGLGICFVTRLLEAGFFLTTWNNLRVFEYFDTSLLNRADYGYSILTAILPWILNVVLDLGLWQMAKSVLKRASPIQYHVAMAFSSFLVLAALAFRLYEIVENAKYILSVTGYEADRWVILTALYVEIACVWWFSLIFILKLVYTMWRQRRDMHVKRSTYMEYLVIGSLCTMIIPSIFAGLQLKKGEYSRFPNPGSIAFTAIVVLMPFSSLWAGAVPTNRDLKLRDLWVSSDSNGMTSSSTIAPSIGADLSSRGSNLASRFARRRGSPAGADDLDVELAELGIRVDHTIDVKSPGEENTPTLPDNIMVPSDLPLGNTKLYDKPPNIAVESRRSRWHRSRKSSLRGTPVNSRAAGTTRDHASQGIRDAKRHKSIKDIIRFYDGAVSTGKNTLAKPSLIDMSEQYSPRANLSVKSPSEENGEGGNKTGFQHDTKMKTLLFRRRSILGSFTGTNRTNMTDERKGRRSTRENGKMPRRKAGNGWQMDASRREVGSKIEALYRVRSMERQSENVPKESGTSKAGRNSGSFRTGRGVGKTRAARNVSNAWLEAGQSRVSDMRRIFDQAFPSRTQTFKKATAETINVEAEDLKSGEGLQGTKETQSLSPAHPPPLPPPPPPMPGLMRKRTSAISLKAILPEQQLRTKDALLDASQPCSEPQHPSPRPRSKVIEDRIGLLEKAKFTDEQLKRRKKENSFSGKIGNSLIKARRSFFESSSWKNTERQTAVDRTKVLKGKNTDGRINGVFDGAQGGAMFGRTKKCDSKIMPGTIELQQLVAVAERDLGAISARGELKEMVIKEVQCGLAEPKPMRLTEMKRMMLLCREKAGKGCDREKEITKASLPNRQ